MDKNQFNKIKIIVKRLGKTQNLLMRSYSDPRVCPEGALRDPLTVGTEGNFRPVLKLFFVSSASDLANRPYPDPSLK